MRSEKQQLQEQQPCGATRPTSAPLPHPGLLPIIHRPPAPRWQGWLELSRDTWRYYWCSEKTGELTGSLWWSPWPCDSHCVGRSASHSWTAERKAWEGVVLTQCPMLFLSSRLRLKPKPMFLLEHIYHVCVLCGPWAQCAGTVAGTAKEHWGHGQSQVLHIDTTGFSEADPQSLPS